MRLSGWPPARRHREHGAATGSETQKPFRVLVGAEHPNMRLLNFREALHGML
jgi:hypothetical protein